MIKQILTMYEQLLSLAKEGDYRNGVVCYGVDEGQTQMNRLLRNHEEFLKKIKEAYDDGKI